ncbi:hypothetical protein CK203_114364 [Vitis vinifera]|uniref:Uncharacterized protein n=1 Tax=Vitis vinifera TaxID=29760 RepID=A0A438EDM1_VITVI|nr:hypothetical protein CK203_114364 [Vitis vinifera]
MSCSQYAMSPIDSEMNSSWIPDLFAAKWNDWASSGLTLNAHWPPDYFFRATSAEFGAREVALEAPEIFLAAPEMLRTRSGNGEELELEPVMELVSSPAALAALASPEEELLSAAKALERSGTGSFRRLFLRFEGDEDLAPRVRAISGYRNLADVADRRR